MFIVAVLALAIWKTKLLRRRAYGNDIETSKIWRDNAAPGSFSVAGKSKYISLTVSNGRVLV